jgi:hypothetical protein
MTACFPPGQIAVGEPQAARKANRSFADEYRDV